MKIVTLLVAAALLSAGAAGAATAMAARAHDGGPNPYGASCNWIGQILLVGFDYAPPGTELAHGQLLSIGTSRDNDRLFTVLGTKFGGNGTTTFALPDLRGKAPAGLHYVVCTSAGRYPSAAGGSGTCNFAGQLALVAFPADLVSNVTVPAHGQLLNGSSYATLFLHYRYTFGGSQSAGTFGVPDLQGKAPPHLHYVVCTHNPSNNYTYSSEDCNWLGQIILAGYMPRAERGTLPAHGQTLPISSNEALYSLFENTFGGDGTKTFALPDLKGKAPAGVHYLVCGRGPYPSRS
jgi:microcystin-dependent protein